MWFDSWAEVLRVLIVGAGSGSGDLSSVAVVVLETNGKLSVIPSSELGDGSGLEGLAAGPKQAK